MDKISKEGENKKVKRLAKIKDLPKDLADAAKGLCRKILRYKGKLLIHGLNGNKNCRTIYYYLLLYNKISFLSFFTFCILFGLGFLLLEYKSTERKEKEYADISDVLLWSIFANRKELAEICWLRSENQLCTYF